ncbi:unnamed protein product [Caretta caretta]
MQLISPCVFRLSSSPNLGTGKLCTTHVQEEGYGKSLSLCIELSSSSSLASESSFSKKEEEILTVNMIAILPSSRLSVSSSPCPQTL